MTTLDATGSSFGAHPRSASRAARGRRGGWRPGYPRLLAALVTAVVLVAAWALLAPRQLGGVDSYAVTDGISMLPRYRADDLVILRSEPSYHVGEVAAYRNPTLGVVVMHRIVARDGNRFVFKGDNNDFIDTYEPTQADIVGAEWVHLHGVGRFVLNLRVPIVSAVLLALLWIFSFGPAPLSRRRRRRHRHAR